MECPWYQWSLKPWKILNVGLHYSLVSSHLSLSREGRWGTTDDFRNQFRPFFPLLHCPLGLGELQACPFPDVVFPPLPLSALSSPPTPLSLCLARWFWPDLMNGRHDHTTAVCISLRSSGDLSCGPIACWILALTSSLVTWSLYEMCSILR